MINQQFYINVQNATKFRKRSRSDAFCLAESIHEQSLLKCNLHNIPCNAYCESCDKPVCQLCKYKVCAAEDHQVTSLINKEKQYKGEVRSNILSLEALKSVADKYMKIVQTNEEDIVCQRERILSQIDAFFHETQKILAEKKSTYVKEIESDTDQTLADHDKKVELMTSSLKKCSEAITLIESALSKKDEPFDVDKSAQVLKQVELLAKESKSLKSEAGKFPAKVGIVHLMPSANSLVNSLPHTMSLIKTQPFAISSNLNTHRIHRINYIYIEMFDKQASIETEIHSSGQYVTGQHKTVPVLIDAVSPNCYVIAYKPSIRGRYKITITKEKSVLITLDAFVPMPLSLLGNPVQVFSGIQQCHAVACTGSSHVYIGSKANVYMLQLKDGEKICTLIDKLNVLKCMYTSGLCEDSNGNLYKVNFKRNEIVRFDKTGKEIHVATKNISGARGLAEHNEHLYICDSISHCIHVLDLDMNTKKQIGKFGAEKECFNECTDIAFDHKNQWMYVVESGNNRVQVLDTNGTFLHYIGIQDSGESILSEPQGISINGGYVYVTEKGGSRVSVFSSSGQLVTHIGEGYLQSPSGIDIDQDGYVWVCDTAKETVFVF